MADPASARALETSAWHRLTAVQALDALGTPCDGLDEDEALARLERFGPEPEEPDVMERPPTMECLSLFGPTRPSIRRISFDSSLGYCCTETGHDMESAPTGSVNSEPDAARQRRARSPLRRSAYHRDFNAAALRVGHIVEAQEVARAPTNPGRSTIVSEGFDLPRAIVAGRHRAKEPIP